MRDKSFDINYIKDLYFHHMSNTGGDIIKSMEFVCDMIYDEPYEVLHFNAILLKKLPFLRRLWLDIPHNKLTDTFLFDKFIDVYYQTTIWFNRPIASLFLYALLGENSIKIMLYGRQIINGQINPIEFNELVSDIIKKCNTIYEVYVYVSQFSQ